MTRPADVRQPYRLDDELHDEVLLNLARHHADIESLLATFFGFLERRTDFFHVLEEPSIRGRPSCSPEGRSMGFREGRAAQMVCDVFSRAQERYRRRAQPHLLKEPLSFSQNLDDKISRSSAAPARASPGCTGQQTSEAATKDSLGVLAQPPEGVGEPGDGAQTKAGKLEAHPVPSGGREASKPGADKITTWNGGECGRYRWSQTFTDLTVQINLDRSKYRSKKDLSVVITSHKLKVMLAQEVLLEGEWEEPVNAADSFWQVEDGAYLLLSVEKGRENWWGAVLKGEQRIDTTKIESVKRVEDFDAATQAHIRKMMFDQQQKLKGEKTSEDIEKEELLKKAWNAEGSPFAGTPFDPSLVSLQGEFPFRSSTNEN